MNQNRMTRAFATATLVLGLSSLAACGNDGAADNGPVQDPSIGSNENSGDIGDDGDDGDDMNDDSQEQDDRDDRDDRDDNDGDDDN